MRNTHPPVTLNEALEMRVPEPHIVAVTPVAEFDAGLVLSLQTLAESRRKPVTEADFDGLKFTPQFLAWWHEVQRRKPRVMLRYLNMRIARIVERRGK